MGEKKLVRRRDLILLAVLLLIGAVMLGYWMLRPADLNGVAEVSVDGKVVMELPLKTDTEVVIDGYGGGENTLVIQDGKADMVSASCPDGICVRHRAISADGESIICLPNRVVVTIRGGEEGVVDAVG